MKKLIALLLALAMVTAMFVACGKNDDKGGNDAAGAQITADAVTVLKSIWEKYPEDQKFPVYGGDGANMVDNAPAAFTDMESLNSMLIVPEDQQESFTEVASLFHGMMLNNFSCGVFKMAEGVDAAAFADTMYDAVKNNQWMCGFPEQVVIATVDGGAYVLVAFGLGDVIETLQTSVTEAYPQAEVKHTGTIG